MSPSGRNEDEAPRHPLLWLAEAFVAVYVILDAVATPLLRPLFSFVLQLRLVQHLTSIIVALPAPAILALLLIALFSADPAKIYGLYLMGTGHLLTGAMILIGAYVVSLILVEQIYQAGKMKLRSLPFFAEVTDWFFDLRDRIISWMRTMPAWAAMRQIESQIREHFVHLRSRCMSFFTSLRM